MLQESTIDLNATSLPLLNDRTVYNEFFIFFLFVLSCFSLNLIKLF